MNAARVRLLSLLASSCGLLLAACGGGGGGGSPAPTPSATPVPVPTSGTYGWLLKSVGPTSAPMQGLSFIHPSAPQAEFVIESPSAALTEVKLLSQGTVDGSAHSASGLVPHTLVYIIGGDMRRVPMAANGSTPSALVQKAGSSSACRFLLSAEDVATPENSRFIVSTAGNDGVCGTSDDGTAEIKLSAAAPGITLTPITGAGTANAPLGVLRDPATMAPRGWIYATQAVLWDSGGTTIALRSASNPIQRVVAATYRWVLVESASGLSVIDFSGGNAASETAVTSDSLTGWVSMGYDGQYFYAYRNSGDASGSWSILRVSQQSPAADVLSSGSGEVLNANLGKNVVFATTATSTAHQLLLLQKNIPGGKPIVLDNTDLSTLSTVATSAGDVHLQQRVTGLKTSAAAQTLSIIDETGLTVYAPPTAGVDFPIGLADAATVSYASSESRTRFVWASGYSTTRGFSGAELVGYDAATRTRTDIGTLPGSSDYGSDFVFSFATVGTPGGFMAGYAVPSVNGNFMADGVKSFSFDAATAASLYYASQQQ